MKMAIANGCHVAMVTTKDIREGDEIFLSYGSGYIQLSGLIEWYMGVGTNLDGTGTDLDPRWP